MEKYVEFMEEETEENEYRPLERYLKYVADDVEAEKLYKDVFKNNDKLTKAQLVEMNHDKDSTKNKPCNAFKFKDGKVDR